MARSRTVARRGFPLIFGGAPAISVSPSSWDFGSTPVGTPVSKVFTIENTGTAALEITLPITIVGAEASAFTVTAQPAVTSLAPGASTTFTVEADADSVDTFNADISIVNNSAENPYTVAIEVLVEYVVLLSDEFITSRAAGAINGTAAEPGAGTRTVVDTNSIMTIANGRFKWNGTGALSNRLVEDVKAPAAGQAWGWVLPVRQNINFRIWHGLVTGVNDLTAHVAGVRHTAQNQIRVMEAGATTITTYTLGVNEHSFVFVERLNGGGLLFARNDLTGNYKLLHVFRRSLGNRRMQVSMFENAEAQTFEMDNWRLVQLDGDWLTDFGNASNHVAAPVSGETLVGDADGEVDFTWTAATGETLDIMFRRTDDNNCWIVRCSVPAGRIYLYQKQAGVETERGASGGVVLAWANGTTYRIVVRFEAAEISVMASGAATQATERIAYASASFNQSATGVKVTGFATGANLATWPVQGWALPAPFDEYSLPESTTLERISEQVLWSSVSEPNWLGRPILLELGDGTWIAFYMAIDNHGPDPSAQIHIRFSADEGQTWTAANTKIGGGAVSGFPLNETVGGKSLTECVAILAPNGDILLHSYERPGGGTNQWRSDDGGESWSHEGIINSDTTLVAMDDAKTIGSDMYFVARVDPGSDFNHPHYLALYTSADNGATWTKLSDVEAVNDCNEAGLLHAGGNNLYVYGKATGELNTYLWRSTDLGVTFGAREVVTDKVGWMNKPKCKTLGGYHWLYGRDYRTAKRSVVYRSLDGLAWEPRFYPFSEGFEYTDENGYCDILQRANGEIYMLGYAGPDIFSASIIEAVFEVV